jgi:glycosyltransferase involved in cell wall biosynthesis
MLERGRPLRILALTRYPRLGASSRLRMHQYAGALARDGAEVEFHAFNDDEYLAAYNAGKRVPAWRLARDYLRRLAVLARAGRFDVLWIQRELFPFLPALGERALALLGVPYVVDYDDATFHAYDQHASGAVRALLGRKIDAVMRHAALVLAGNDYLAERARLAGAPWVEIVPTVVDASAYPVRDPANDVPVIGWIGSPSTRRHLALVEPALVALRASGHAFRVRTVGATPPFATFAGSESVEWREDAEADECAGFDIGVMPLHDAPFERGKCGYKLVQYMAAARPVVASPVGVNRELVHHGGNGFLAADDGQWLDALRRLLEDDALRRRMGAQGRARVEADFDLAGTGPRVSALLHSVAARPSPVHA